VRVVAACVLLGLLAWARPGHAEGLYRCAGTNGEAVFTGSTEGYRDCTAMNVVGQRPISSARLARAGTPAAKPTAPVVADRPARSHARVLKGAVYQVRRADGSIEYTNVRPRSRPGHAVTRLFTYIDTCAACNLHSPVDWKHVPLNLTAYAGAVRNAATEYGVDPALLRAVIHAESAFNPHAMSAKGAQGLMQLMPDTAGDLGVHDAFDATQNIRGGAHYLAQLLKTFGGDTRLAAAAYNAGPAAVQKYAGVPPYAETRVYVDRVAALKRRYAAALAGPVTLAAAP
jgi:hypothetical protein